MKETKRITLDEFLKEKHEGKKRPEENPEKQGPYELPEGWKWVKLAEVARINKEERDPRKEPDKEFIYIDISSVEGGTGHILRVKKILGKKAPSRARRVIHTDDVIMSTVRPYLKSFTIIPKEFDDQICSTGFAVLSCQEWIIPKYLFYVLFSDIVIHQCNEMMIGAHYPALRFDQVAQIMIPLPPIEEQKRIVSRLEQLVSRAEEAKRLRRMAKEETEKIMQAALNKVFSRAKEEGWDWIKLEDCCKINPSCSEIKHLPDDIEVTFVPMTAVNEITGRIEKPEVRLLGEVRRGYTYFKEGDILFAKITPCMENGKSAIARNLINGIGFGSTEFHVLRPLKDRVISEWVHYYIRQKSFRDEAARNMTGSVGQQRVPVQFMKSVKIPLPSLDEQRKLVTYLNKMTEKVGTLKIIQQKTEEDIEKLIPAILDKAFKGEL